MYLALKRHFSSESYDFFRYKGKVSASASSFLGRRDKYQFQKLCRACSEDELLDYMVANFIKGKSWVGDFTDDDARDNFKDYVKRKQSLSYIFGAELTTLFSKYPPNELFKVGEEAYPPIVNLMNGDKVSLETFSILDSFLNFSEAIDKSVGADDIIWSKVRMLSKKFHPFIQYDRSKFRKILLEKVEDHK